MNATIQYIIEQCKIRLGLDLVLNQSKDQHGNIVYLDKNSLHDDVLLKLLTSTLEELLAATGKNFNLNNIDQVIPYTDLLIKGTVVKFLGRQALIEKGREFNISDEQVGISLNPPKVSEVIQKQFEIEFKEYCTQLADLKKLNQITYFPIFPNINTNTGKLAGKFRVEGTGHYHDVVIIPPTTTISLGDIVGGEKGLSSGINYIQAV